MKDILEVVKLKLELEEKAKQIFEQNNSNIMGAATEHIISRWLTNSKGSQYLCIGGNQKGFDVTCDKFKDTYEVKHTNTTSSAYHYGNLESKDAKHIVFVKWEYGSLLNAEYAYIFPNNVVKEHLNKRGKFTMSNLRKTAHLAEDITESLNNFIIIN
tara:strand:- start:622 stop:1092 length:471 start_codon:yes stop_codon:yes gene_type:complete